MTFGRLFFFSKPDPSRPIENKYVTEINGERQSFVSKNEAMLYMFDCGVTEFRYMTKEEHEYVNLDNLLLYEFWHIHNRVGYVTYDYEPYIDGNNLVKKRRAYVWRFIGFGRSCFAKSKSELKTKVTEIINYYNEDQEERGYNIYPYYTDNFR